MNQFRNHVIIGLFFAFGLFLVGCDKTSDNPTNATTQKPTSPKVTFDGPNTTSSNSYALEAKSYSQLFNSLALQFSSLADMPGGTQNGNVWTYTYTAGSFTETISVEVLSDGSNKWKVMFSGTETGSSVTYVNWVAFEGTSSADGKSGSQKFYEDNTTTIEVEISWSTSAQGNETGILKSYTSGVLDEQLEIVNNTDGSGSMKLYEKKSGSVETYLSLDISWITNGTGTYKLYNEAGTVTSQGTF